MSSDLTFITNQSGKNLRDRFGVLLGEDTRFFDCLVGYFFIGGFHKLHRALTKTEKIRILIGIKTDGATYDFIVILQRDKKGIGGSKLEAASKSDLSRGHDLDFFGAGGVSKQVLLGC